MGKAKHAYGAQKATVALRKAAKTQPAVAFERGDIVTYAWGGKQRSARIVALDTARADIIIENRFSATVFQSQLTFVKRPILPRFESFGKRVLNTLTGKAA